jgi:hypothetical protein
MPVNQVGWGRNPRSTFGGRRGFASGHLLVPEFALFAENAPTFHEKTVAVKADSSQPGS